MTAADVDSATASVPRHAGVDIPRAAAAILLVLGLEALTLLGLRNRVVVGLSAATLAGVVMLSWRVLRENVAPRVLGMAVAVSALLIALPMVLPARDAAQAMLDELLPTIIGWTAFAVLAGVRDESSTPWRVSWTMSRARMAALLAATFALLVTAHALAVGRWAIIDDEVVYVVQSAWMRLPQLTWSVDPAIADFFRMRKIGWANGHFVPMYPPGWPALLALFRAVGLQWWASIVLGTTTVWLVYKIGERVQGAVMGGVAAILCATSQVFLLHHAGYMSHAATMCSLLGATLCLLVGERASGRTRVVAWIVAGGLLGYAVTVRPLTGIALGTSIGLWMMLRLRRELPGVLPTLAIAIAIGGCVPGILFAIYNVQVFGHPLTVGYSFLNGHLYDLGFGTRGFDALGPDLQPVPRTTNFTPMIALRDLVHRLTALNTTFIPVGMLLPTAVLAVSNGYRIAWSRVAAFALIPFAYFFYWWGGLRVYTELLPFLMLGVASMIVAIGARRPRLAGSLIAVLIGTQAILALPWPVARADSHRPWSAGVENGYGGAAPGRFATFNVADSIAKANGKILLFASEKDVVDNFIVRLYWFNQDRLDGPVLVARDRGAKNAELIRHFPDRVPFLVVDQGPTTAAQFTRIAP